MAKTIFETGQSERLKELLHHDNIDVRYYAAAYLLPIDAKLAETELEKISQCYGHMLGTTAFNAEMTLKEWRKGNIKFDY